MTKPPLLLIRLEELHDIPTVIYKGEELTGRIKIKFEWHTKDDKQVHVSPFIDIKTIDKEIVLSGIKREQS